MHLEFQNTFVSCWVPEHTHQIQFDFQKTSDSTWCPYIIHARGSTSRTHQIHLDFQKTLGSNRFSKTWNHPSCMVSGPHFWNTSSSLVISKQCLRWSKCVHKLSQIIHSGEFALTFHEQGLFLLLNLLYNLKISQRHRLWSGSGVSSIWFVAPGNLWMTCRHGKLRHQKNGEICCHFRPLPVDCDLHQLSGTLLLCLWCLQCPM